MNTHRCFDNCLGWSIVLLNAILVAIELKFKHKFHKRLRDLEKTMKINIHTQLSGYSAVKAKNQGYVYLQS